MFPYEKKVSQWKIVLLKKTFFTEKNINENVINIYLISKIYIFTQKIFVLQRKYKFFLKIYAFCKKQFFKHKRYICKNFVVNSMIWSLKFWKQPICGIPEISSSQNIKTCQHFFISGKTAPKTDRFFNFLPYIQRPSFQYHKIRHPNFCNILHLQMDF